MARAALRQLSRERRALQRGVMQRSLARREPLDRRVTRSAQLGCAALGALEEPLRNVEANAAAYARAAEEAAALGAR